MNDHPLHLVANNQRAPAVHVKQSGAIESATWFLQWLDISGYFYRPEVWQGVERAGLYTAAEHKEKTTAAPCLASTDRARFFDHVPPTMCKSAEAVTGGTPKADRFIRPHRACKSPTTTEREWLIVPLCSNHYRLATGKWCGHAFRHYLYHYARDLVAHQVRRIYLDIAGKRNEITPHDLQRVENLIGVAFPRW